MAEQGLTTEQIGEFRQAFDHFDRDGDGMITTSELKEALVAWGQKDAKDSEVQDLIAEVDPSGIDFSEFLSMMSRKMNETDTGDEGWAEAFKTFDKNNDGARGLSREEPKLTRQGFITGPELLAMLSMLGEKLSAAECDEMIREADADGDGKINLKEFTQLMKSA